ncbi:hypothetical protein [Streptomyces sp. Je 1-369]|uniref:hypothetical protein n=1 Tax=Streptomyces sp. Je 1-369 TaxID=2966192 RepID=UPI0022864E92|nr:hypothetical protein [Streptomyces sp. Je 1-369]WAL98007.1 hypothetical protein NOO62_28085 [Streptomyces sp. Je 1-369]
MGSTATRTRPHADTAPAPAPAPDAPVEEPRPTGRRDTDGMAVASFILGLVGLLVLNLVLGPIAIVLATIALWRGTTRRGRALLGLGLGVADLVVLAALVSVDNTVSWGLAG